LVQEHFIDISKELTTEDVLTKLSGSIAVVGNGTMGRHLGEIIDSYDNVIRINKFELNGYENLVGKKTSLWCTFGDIYKIPHPFAISPFLQSGIETTAYPPEMKIIYAMNDSHSILGIDRPTTGGALLSLFHYLKISVSIFGFDFLKSPEYFNPNIPILKCVHTNFLLKEENFLRLSPYIEIK
jgi:hypothetical protein